MPRLAVASARHGSSVAAAYGSQELADGDRRARNIALVMRDDLLKANNYISIYSLGRLPFIYLFEGGVAP